ncbi:RNA-binding S4 domain-containing protein [Cellulomonas carbonis]|uniref:RNA-binding protein S4 n=1 Tax=Cellulomonas carbonis T26 TaxID=947969 RepID=A0A0A0BME6_9CELL|nr:RNA-binding S4 domain-containing protein [Cellulomonas carbonis]KGM09673.1 RNA-binding protein S4 [Cellulomonas carbonis T26]GGB96941.1 RNA-binding protein S4 [Cellulomonas carbonis]
MDARIVDVDGEIRLGQLLKLAGVAESGSHARSLLGEGEVTVNGEPETRRGRQLAPGDVVVVSLPGGDEEIRVR